MPYPLWPPNGSSAPFRPAAGSVVPWPCSSTAQPSGIDWPRRAAFASWPAATMLVATSSTIGISFPGAA